MSPIVGAPHRDKNTPRHRFACEIDGKEYQGTYWIAGKIMTVSTGLGGKSRQIGDKRPEALAIQLLGVLAREGKA